MTDLKFRAYSELTKSIVNIEAIQLGDTNHAPSVRHSGNILEFLEDVQLMQFTGIQDLNDIDIYEGDIVEENFYFDLDIYDEEDSRFFIIKRGLYYSYPGEVSGLFIPNNDHQFMRIRGNIHENPELINKCRNKND